MNSTLLLTELFPPATGGSSRWFWEIYRRLPRSRVVIAAGEHPRHAEFDRTHDLRVVRMPLSFSTWGLLSRAGLAQYCAVRRQILQIARAENVATIHCGKCLPEGLLAWLIKRKLGLPYTCYVHGEELGIAEGSRELRWWTRRVLHGAARVIANSRNTEQLLSSSWRVPAERLTVLHPGVDTEHFQPAPRDSTLRRRLGWGERPVVLTVGRLQKRKGHDMMLRALPEIRRAVPDVLYVILGEGEERATLERLVAELDLASQVQFLGEATDAALRDCYQQCDLFALANRQVGRDFEGFGMVLVEAQACGKPVIAGASGGTAETMRSPETGLIVPCDSPEPLAKAVIELLRDPDRRRAMGEAGREWVVKNFDWTALAAKAEALFTRSQVVVAQARSTSIAAAPTLNTEN